VNYIKLQASQAYTARFIYFNLWDVVSLRRKKKIRIRIRIFFI